MKGEGKANESEASKEGIFLGLVFVNSLLLSFLGFPRPPAPPTHLFFVKTGLLFPALADPELVK